jgi:hypothetical protein
MARGENDALERSHRSSTSDTRGSARNPQLTARTAQRSANERPQRYYGAAADARKVRLQSAEDKRAHEDGDYV